MSSALMSKTEALNISEIEPIFEGVEEVMDGPRLRRSVIGEVSGEKIARVRRVSMTVLKKEVSHHDYQVDLVAPYGRFSESLSVVYSSLWMVTPIAAMKNDVIAEAKDFEQFAVINKKTLESMSSPEEMFAHYDALPKITPATTPDISPSIYTPEGMRELLKTAKFRSMRTNG